MMEGAMSVTQQPNIIREGGIVRLGDPPTKYVMHCLVTL